MTRTSFPFLTSAILFAAAITADGRPAYADEASDAQIQFDLASSLYRQRRYAEAVEHFIASNRIVPNTSVAFNIAQTYALMNRPVDAVNWYESLLATDIRAELRTRATAARDALLPRVAIIDVRTDPPGASIYVDRVELGAVAVAPRRIAVPPGSHRIVARRAGHRDGETVVETASRSTTNVVISLAALRGTLAIRTDPPGATVSIAGQVVDGVTPLDLPVPVGRAEVRVTLQNHAEQTRAIEIAEGVRTESTFTLVPIASRAGVISVRSNVPGSVVRVAGGPARVAPLSLGGLEPGGVRLEVIGPNGLRWRDSVLVEAGAATRVDVTLVDPRSLPWPGWRYLGYALGGAVIAGGGAVASVAYAEREQFFADNQAATLHRVETLDVAADAMLIGGLSILAATALIDWLSGPRPHTHASVTVHR